jgi:DNA polymerase III subunit chi
MTRVEFFFNVKDKHQKIADLSEKFLLKGLKLMVFVSNAEAVAITQNYLWQQPASFLPNLSLGDELAEVTPIIVDCERDDLVHDEVLINFQHPHPPFFSRFKRLVEIVGIDEADKDEARVRFKFYRDRGYQITVVDDSKAGVSQ